MISTSRKARLTAAVSATLALACVLTPIAASAGPPSPSWPTGQAGVLQRDADAITGLGVVGVQAEVTGDVPSGSVIVTSGVADRATAAPVPADGRFRIASTRKTFDAVVVLQLVAERRLSLDDAVERWLPGVVRGHGNDGRRITVRHLLQNTSGIHDDLPDYTTAAEYLQQRYEVHSRDELIARAMKHRPDFTPGRGWGYSNTGFMLLDAVIEKVTDQPLEKVIRDRIVHPLALTTLSWPKTSPYLPDPHSQAYQLFPGDGLVDTTDQVIDDRDSINGTTHDLTTFFRALLGGRLLRPAQLAEMKRTVAVSPEVAKIWPKGRYGLGLVRRHLSCGGFYWGHDGGWGGSNQVTGVTADGRRSAVVTMSTSLSDSFDHLLRQHHTGDVLIDHALCGTSTPDPLRLSRP
jgi:D-alanyl-D-alanine carboxypeptidase